MMILGVAWLLISRAGDLQTQILKRFWKFSILTKFWELFSLLAHLEVTKNWEYFFGAEKLILQYIKHPYIKANFGRAGARPTDIAESCRRGYADSSWARSIGDQKK